MSASEITVEQDIIDERCDVSARDWRWTQAKDQELGIIIDHLRNRIKPDRTKFIGHPGVTKLLKHFHQLELKRGVLYRVVKTQDETQEQIVLPTRCCPQMRTSCQGCQRRKNLIKSTWNPLSYLWFRPSPMLSREPQHVCIGDHGRARHHRWEMWCQC